eukprot:2954561-Amphidinium_carterae.1
MLDTTTRTDEKNQAHRHEIPTCTTAAKRRRTKNTQSIDREQSERPHDEVLGDSKDQEAQ